MKEETNKTNQVILNSQRLDVPINEFYTLVLNEYNCERDRKQSIETRSGIIVTISMAFFAIVLRKINLFEVISLFKEPLSFNLLVEILAGLFVYVSYFLSMFFSMLSLKSNIYAFYSISAINTAILMSDRISNLGQLILDYVEIIKTNRKVNDKKVYYFNKAILFLVICIVCICLYIFFNTWRLNNV